MKIKTKIINEKTFEVLVINQIEAERLGYEEMEVDFVDGKYYVKGKAPKPSLNKLKELKIQELKSERDKYKKSVFIKDNYSLMDVDPIEKSYNYYNLINQTDHWTLKDKEIYIEYIEDLCKQYNAFKNKINLANSEKDLKFEIVFKKYILKNDNK